MLWYTSPVLRCKLQAGISSFPWPQSYLIISKQRSLNLVPVPATAALSFLVFFLIGLCISAEHKQGNSICSCYKMMNFQPTVAICKKCPYPQGNPLSYWAAMTIPSFPHGKHSQPKLLFVQTPLFFIRVITRAFPPWLCPPLYWHFCFKKVNWSHHQAMVTKKMMASTESGDGCVEIWSTP